MGSPAVAHKAIGVGAVRVSNLTTVYQINGPTSDGRVKPDIQAPTETATASSSSDTALKSSFNGTSGSTPYAAGAAALMWSQRQKSNFPTLPGYVYAWLIQAGNNRNSPAYDNIKGAGLIEVQPIYDAAGYYYFQGKASVSQGQYVTILNLPTTSFNFRNLDCAIWWPENRSVHKDIDLKLIDPTNTTRSSSSVNSVFEKIGLLNYTTNVSGTWAVKMYGYSVSSPQEVYYSCAANTN